MYILSYKLTVETDYREITADIGVEFSGRDHHSGIGDYVYMTGTVCSAFGGVFLYVKWKGLK